MIAVDTCVVIDFLQGEDNPQAQAFAGLLAEELAVLAPSTVTELLSDPIGGPVSGDLIAQLKRLEVQDGYWERAGLARATLKGRGLKAALGDALIAQACLDADVPLLTRDADFRSFAQWCGLKLA